MRTALALDRYKRRFGPQEKREEGDIVLEPPSLAVAEIIRRYDKWLSWLGECEMEDARCIEDAYGLQGLKATPKDIFDFSVYLKNFERRKRFEDSGTFISELIRNCPEQHFELMTELLRIQINLIGYRNKKNITVIGDVGEFCCSEMEEGCVVSRGSAGDSCGINMLGGVLAVRGNVGSDIAEYMNGGNIVVDGDAAEGVGKRMYSGRVFINGNFGSISEGFEGGQIVHRGVLIRDKIYVEPPRRKTDEDTV